MFYKDKPLTTVATHHTRHCSVLTIMHLKCEDSDLLCDDHQGPSKGVIVGRGERSEISNLCKSCNVW